MLHWGSWVFIRLGWCLWTTGLHNVITCQTSLKSWWLMGKKLDGRVLQNCHLHMDETFVCHIFYKQISCPKCMKLTKFMSWEGNPERSHTFLVESWAKNFRLIPSQKTLGSWDFAKSCLGNPGIENSWSRWGQSPRGAKRDVKKSSKCFCSNWILVKDPILGLALPRRLSPSMSYFVYHILSPVGFLLKKYHRRWR